MLKAGLKDASEIAVRRRVNGPCHTLDLALRMAEGRIKIDI